MGDNTENRDLTGRLKSGKRDWVLVLVILAAAACLLLAFRLFGGGSADMAVVRVDGRIHKSYPLAVDGIYSIETEYGLNVIEIRDGAVTVKEADCPGHDCMRQGPISRQNEMIVCLPHRLVVEITDQKKDGGQTPEFDTVAK